MRLMRHRPYLRALTPHQRRLWWEHKKRLNFARGDRRCLATRSGTTVVRLRASLLVS